MNAVIRIDFREYLVKDARKALALVELLQKSQVVARTPNYVADQIQLSDEAPRVEMQVLPQTTKILPAKTRKEKP